MIIIVAVVERNGNAGIAECVFLVFNGILLALKDQHFAFETLKACDGIRCNGRFVGIVPIAAPSLRALGREDDLAAGGGVQRTAHADVDSAAVVGIGWLKTVEIDGVGIILNDEVNDLLHRHGKLAQVREHKRENTDVVDDLL